MILALSGGLGSGKSTISDDVAGRLEWLRASFGVYVRSVARSRLLPDTREVLQDLGASLLRDLGAEAFCSATLRQSGWTPGAHTVLDGVRHRDVLSALQRLDSVRLVFVVADEMTRVERLRAADRLPEDLRQVERHSTEVEVASVLRTLADLVVDGTRPAAVLVDEIAAWVTLQVSE